MKYCLDELSYQNNKVTVSGWAAPECMGDTLQVTLVADNELPMEEPVRYIERGDVVKAVYGKEENLTYGFAFSFHVEQPQNCEIELVSREHPNDVLYVDIDVEGMVYKYRKERSAWGVFRRYLKSKNKKQFWKEEKYYDLKPDERKYAMWYDAHQPSRKEKERQRQQEAQFQYAPLISIIVPVYSPEQKHFDAMIQSVKAQTYTNWQLCLANGSGMDLDLERTLREYATQDERIKIARLKENRGISGNTNVALKMAEGEWIVLLDQDDLLSEEALYQLIYTMNKKPKAEVIYSDEDKLEDETGIHCDPHLKPDYNPVLLNCTNYICHLFAVKREIALRAGGFRSDYDGAQDYDFILRCIEQSNGEIVHIAKILYTWRCHRTSTAANPLSKKYAFVAGQHAVEDSYKRKKIDAKVTMLPSLGWYESQFALKERVKVSVILLAKECSVSLDEAVSVVEKHTSYENYEILVVSGVRDMSEKEGVHLIQWQADWTASDAANFAVEQASGEYLVFLDALTKPMAEDWLERMLGYAQQESVGVVGAKLCDGEQKVVQAGLAVGKEGILPLSEGIMTNDPGYMARSISAQNVSTVSHDGMMVKKSLYQSLGGMKPVYDSLRAVDFCLEMQKAGYWVVYDAFVSMCVGAPKETYRREEFDTLSRAWSERLAHDPYYNENFSVTAGSYQLSE